jgi:hypothetical protein
VTILDGAASLKPLIRLWSNGVIRREKPAMRQTLASRLAWSFWVVSALFTGAGLALLALSATTPIPERFGFRGFPAIFALAFSTVGAIVASRRKENPIGWVFCGLGLMAAAQVFAEEYAIYAILAKGGALPYGEWAAWLQNWVWDPVVGFATTFLFVLFPVGRLVSPLWWLVMWPSPFCCGADGAGLRADARSPLLTPPSSAILLASPIVYPPAWYL